VVTKKKKISQLAGIGRKMPLTMSAFAIASLGVIGLPPGGGFLSKWQLLSGTIEGHFTPFILVYLISSFLAAAYLFPVIATAFFGKGDESELQNIREAPLWCLVPLCITGLISVLLFFSPDPFYSLAAQIAKGAVGG